MYRIDKITWQIDVRCFLITMALIHSYFVDIFVHGKLLHSSASRTHVTIYDVKKCQQNTRESMPKCTLLFWLWKRGRYAIHKIALALFTQPMKMLAFRIQGYRRKRVGERELTVHTQVEGRGWKISRSRSSRFAKKSESGEWEFSSRSWRALRLR